MPQEEANKAAAREKTQHLEDFSAGSGALVRRARHPLRRALGPRAARSAHGRRLDPQELAEHLRAAMSMQWLWYSGGVAGEQLHVEGRASHRADATQLRVDLLWRGATASLGVARRRLLGEEEDEGGEGTEDARGQHGGGRNKQM